jgi:hypothetical protein
MIFSKYGVEELILASSAISSRDKMVEIFKKYSFSNKSTSVFLWTYMKSSQLE